MEILIDAEVVKISQQASQIPRASAPKAAACRSRTTAANSTASALAPETAKIRRRGGNRSDESGSASSSSSTTFSAPDDELVGATEVQAGKVLGKWQKEGRSTNNYRLKKISRW